MSSPQSGIPTLFRQPRNLWRHKLLRFSNSLIHELSGIVFKVHHHSMFVSAILAPSNMLTHRIFPKFRSLKTESWNRVRVPFYKFWKKTFMTFTQIKDKVVRHFYPSLQGPHIRPKVSDHQLDLVIFSKIWPKIPLWPQLAGLITSDLAMPHWPNYTHIDTYYWYWLVWNLVHLAIRLHSCRAGQSGSQTPKIG